MIEPSIMLGVSIIICCYNSAQRLPETLARLKMQVVPGHIPWEVIVVDNASTDGTGEVAMDLWGEFPGVPFRVVPEPEPGLMNARMKGFESAQYEFISFIDDDNWVADNWVQMVYDKMLEYPRAGAIGGRSEAVFESDPPEWFNHFHHSFAIGKQADSEKDITTSRGWLWGAGLVIRKSAWCELFDENYAPYLRGREGKQLTTGEDVELCYRIILKGWRIYYSPLLYLKHYIETKRFSWIYLCKLMQSNGRASIYLEMYENTIKWHENKFSYGWLKSLFSIIFYLLKHPKTFLLASCWKGEGLPYIALFHVSIGQLKERIKLLWRIRDIELKIREESNNL